MKLRDFLTGSGQSLAEFAEKVGVSEVSMGRYAAGKRMPRPEILRRIVAASGGAVEANDFFAPPGPGESTAPGEPTAPAGETPNVGGAAETTPGHPSRPALAPGTVAIDMLLGDISGILRGKRLTPASLGKLFGQGITMPASIYAVDVTGGNVDASGVGMPDGDPDAICRPVPGTLAPVPWAERPSAQVLTSMYHDDGRPHLLDPRHVLARVAARLGELDLRPVMAHELEFYLLDGEPGADGAPRLAASAIDGRRPSAIGVYGMDEIDDASALVDGVVAACEAQAIPADVAIAEYSPGQYEINLAHQADPLAAADHAMLFKRAVKGVARTQGQAASFMAKPFAGHSGSGLHLHVSLLDGDGQNVFDERRAGGGERLRQAVAGLQAVAAEAMAVYAPNANSYRRFEPEAYAPMTPTWGFDNRSVALRIPAGGGMARRIEHRHAGADANPYLVAAVVLAGIHHGLANRLEPDAPIEGNAYEQVEPSLPVHWLDALRAHDRATVLPGYFGAGYWRVYSACKWQELNTFNARITPTEYEWYLRAL